LQRDISVTAEKYFLLGTLVSFMAQNFTRF
jgi:hypothetical protein